MTYKDQGKELSMRKLREILRLCLEYQMGDREIGRSLSISHSTVGRYRSLVQKAGLSYAQIQQMDDKQLELAMKNSSKEGGSVEKENSRPQPDWEWVHKELKKKGVTMQLLWQEYKEIHPEGYQLSQFYRHYNEWSQQLHVCLRQTHKAGEKMFVDYAGQTVPITDPHTGQITEAQIFVAVLGASNYSYAEASLDQSIESWVFAHIHAFEFFQGVPQLIVCDNLKSGVVKACRYEPDVNPTYLEMAVHYGTAIMPARVRKPKDKAKVETGVRVVEQWILAALRNRTFFSINGLNEDISDLLQKLNEHPFKKLKGSRLSWFETIEKSQLKPLPDCAYVLVYWKKARVNIDYHIELLSHYYSVPYKIVHQEVQIRYTLTTVEIFHKGERVSSHLRDDQPGGYSTHKEHMPKSHQAYLEWTPSRIIRWAQTVGPQCASLVERIMQSRAHPEQGYRSCLGILRLAKHYSQERLEAACNRTNAIGASSYKSVRSILEKGLDQQPLPEESKKTNLILHSNIRGGDYYH